MPHLTAAIAQTGPLIDVLIHVSQPRMQALRAAGQPVPSPVPARMLIDTGASSTAVDPSVVQALQLQPTGTIPIHTPSTAGTPHTVLQYDVGLYIPSRGTLKPFATLPVIASPFLVQRIHGLLGRDVLAECLLIYNGPDSTLTLSV